MALNLCAFLVFVVNNKYNTEVFSYAYKSFHLTIGTLEAVSSAKPRLVLALARQPKQHQASYQMKSRTSYKLVEVSNF